jgi:RNA polymerase sigma factor (sigma-70 family)
MDYPVGILMRHLRRLAGTQEVRDQSDQALVRRFAESRDEAAFEALVRRHGSMVLAVCRRVLGNEADAEDAFQATFLVLARKPAAIRKRSSVGSWLHGIALRVSLRARAAAARRRAREQQTLPRSADSAHAGLRELAAMLDDELDRLPAKYRDPLVLCYLEGLTRAEAAKQLGWCLRTLMRRIEHGRELLRRRLIRQGFTLSAALCASALGEYVTAAPVTAVLVHAAVRQALLATAAMPATAAVPAQVTALADGLLRAMALKLKIFLAIALLAMGSAVAALGLSRRENPVQPPSPLASETPKVQAQKIASTTPVSKRRPDDVPPDARVAGGRKGFGHGEPVSSVAFMANGKALASASDGDNGSIRSWDVASGKELYSIQLNGPVFVLALSRAGNLLAAAGKDRLIRLWDATTGKGLRVLRGHDDAVYALVFSKDGKTLFSGDFAGTVRLWEVAGGTLIDTLSTPPGHWIHALALSPDGKTLAAACQHKGKVYHPIHLWDTATRQERVDISRAHNGAVFALAFSNDGNILASAGSDGYVRLWDQASGNLVRELARGATFAIQTLAFSPLDGTLAGGSMDSRLCTWDPATGRLLGSRYAHGHKIVGRKRAEFDSFTGTTALAFSPDGATLVSGGSDERLRVWDATTGRERSFDDRDKSSAEASK